MNLPFIKKIVPANLKRAVKEHFGVPSLHSSLLNIKRIGYRPMFALDIGAYEGEWALAFSQVFPDAKIMMIEAQALKKPKLEVLASQNPNLSYQIGLLSDCDGKILYFNENETASHVTGKEEKYTKEVKSESLDALIKRRGASYPDFMKLDVQGFEKQVLNGGRACLARANFCLLEVTMIDLGNETLVLEMMNYMEAVGFQLYDITQLMRRPYDKALYQSDFLFIKKTSNLIATKRWD